MKKQPKWHLFLIFTALLLTVYNILPTLLFYSKPLNKPVEAAQAKEIISSITNRVNGLQKEAISWLESFNRLIQIQAKRIAIVPNRPQLIEVQLSSKEDKKQFINRLPKAGSLIPFYPATLSLSQESPPLEEEAPFVVYVQRKIPTHVSPSETGRYFQYQKIHQPDGSITPECWDLWWKDRIIKLILTISAPTETNTFIQLALQNPSKKSGQEFLFLIAKQILLIDKVCSNQPQIAKRFYASFTNGFPNPKETLEELSQRMEDGISLLQKDAEALKETFTRTPSNFSNRPFPPTDKKRPVAKKLYLS